MKRRKRVTCPDGFTVSVQASENHYCSPRNDSGPYTEVEVGYPSEWPDEWQPWREGEDGDVAGYLPVEDLVKVLCQHGWISDGEIPPLDIHGAYRLLIADTIANRSEE